MFDAIATDTSKMMGHDRLLNLTHREGYRHLTHPTLILDTLVGWLNDLLPITYYLT